MTNLIGPNKLVLEFGCSTGYMSRVLKKNGCRVTGVEIDSEAVKQAADICDRVIVSDAESAVWRAELEHDRFQVIVFGDVLEHLKDPLSVLQFARQFLTKDGYVVASIPNIAHGSVRLALLSGEFNYRRLGLLDDTHLRFFTKETIQEFFAKAGFRIDEMQCSTAGIFEVEIPVRRELYPARLITHLESEEDALTYQFICKAVPAEHSLIVDQVCSRFRNVKQKAAVLHYSLQEAQKAASLLEDSLKQQAQEITVLQQSYREREEHLRQEHREKEKQLLQKQREHEENLAARDATLQAVLNSKGWKLLNQYRQLKTRLRKPIAPLRQMAAHVLRRRRTVVHPDVYQRWIQLHEQAEWNSGKIRQVITNFSFKPKISIVMPVYNTGRDYLEKAIQSVQAQLYDDWELCICDDGSKEKYIRSYLEACSRLDGRIKVVFAPKNEGISLASNRALGLACGEFVGLLDHDDELTPGALYEVVKLLQDDREADMIYSDEDKLNPDGTRCDPFFKPDWSPEYFLSCMYTCHFGVYRKKLLEEIGGFRIGFEGSQDYDLVLRLTEKTNRIRHIPKILYHWRMIPGSAAGSSNAKPYAYAAAKRALSEHLERSAKTGRIEEGKWPSHYRVKFEIDASQKVTIIIPTRDKLNLLKRCIESIESRTTYSDYEILVVDNQSSDPTTLSYLSTFNHQAIRFSEPFNFSRIINFGAKHAQGKYLIFLNNDTEVISSEWISAMLEFGQRSEIGVVGAKLLYPDKRIQHVGVVIGLGGVAGHPLTGFPDNTAHHFGAAGAVRNCSAVTAACMMVRQDVFESVGGFNEKLAVAFNDVDFCLRVREAGYRIVWTPYAELYHYESASRGYTLDPSEIAYMQNRWAKILLNDPYYNPNLTLERENFGLRMHS